MKMLGRVRQYVSQKVALQLYRTHIIPDLDYGDQIYDSMSPHLAHKLQVMQNACHRICTNSQPRTPTEELHTKAGIATLCARRKAHTFNFVYKGVNNMSSAGVDNIFKENRPTNHVNTRATTDKQLHVAASRLEKCKGNIRIWGAMNYNDIPTEIRQKTIYDSFKRGIKKHLGV